MGEDIYLYAINLEETILYYKGKIINLTEFPPIGMRTILPEMAYRDVDGDGERELVIIIESGSGTGVSIRNLYIILFDDDGNYSIAYLLGSNVHKWLTEPIVFEVQEETRNLLIEFAGQSFIFESLIYEDSELVDVGTASVAIFEFERSAIRVIVGVAKHYEAMRPIYIVNIEAIVNFDGVSFEFSDFELKPLRHGVNIINQLSPLGEC